MFSEIDRLDAVRSVNPASVGSTQELRVLAELAQQVYDVPRAAVHLLDDHWQLNAVQVGIELPDCSRDIAICTRVVTSGQTLVIPDMRQVPALSALPFVTQDPFLRFYAGAPVAVEDGLVVGSFCIVDTEPRSADTVDRQSLIRFAEVASALLRLQRNNFRLSLSEKDWRYAALTDPLTLFYNRAALPALVDPMLEARATAASLSGVLYLDMDGFKSINDRFGHAVGDEVLSQAAARIRTALSPSDIVVRMGGDEFAIFIEQVASCHELALLAERLLALFRLPFVIGREQLSARLSIGGALSGAGRAEREALLHSVDQALYRAKAAGRDCSIIQDLL
ncbi:sensor domain-containing diguanylate cyclase [Rhizobium sp. SGZ-381]|uniref:sensor domain-containing diguanylate cyclase n=1 Tax=Rhizobium sp. SGZ-381 TaxID=3342800 RepID=UPI0036723021